MDTLTNEKLEERTAITDSGFDFSDIEKKLLDEDALKKQPGRICSRSMSHGSSGNTPHTLKSARRSSGPGGRRQSTSAIRGY